jgi:hypothetical protein
MSAFPSNFKNGDFGTVSLLRTVAPDYTSGGVILSSGTNTGTGSFTWDKDDVADATLNITAGSPIASDMTKSVYAIVDDAGTRSLGWWVIPQGTDWEWQGTVQTEWS